MANRDHDARSLLLGIGVGDFNATMVIPYLFMAPAQMDPSMPAYTVMVEALQKTLNELGAGIAVTGELDAQTVVQLRRATGRDWPNMDFFRIIQKVLHAKDLGLSLRNVPQKPAPIVLPRAATAISGTPLLGFVDDLPGGAVGFVGALGVGLYLLFGRKKRTAKGR